MAASESATDTARSSCSARRNSFGRSGELTRDLSMGYDAIAAPYFLVFPHDEQVDAVKQDFQQVDWNASLAEECKHLVQLARLEDMRDEGDLTSAALIPAGQSGRAAFVPREMITLAGLPASKLA